MELTHIIKYLIDPYKNKLIFNNYKKMYFNIPKYLKYK